MGPNVLIVGAGPTGLVLALWLIRQGIRVRIIDKSAGPGETSRAMVVQARTLELYRQLDLAEDTIAAGHPNLTVNLWVEGKRKAQISFENAGAGLTPYPFVLVYPQDQHERLLIEKLEALGVGIERCTELISFEEVHDSVSARLRLPEGTEETCKVDYLAGCDGARSAVRHQIGASFEGGTYPQVFYVADVEFSGIEPADQTHIALDQSDFVAVLSYGKPKQARLIGTIADERAEHAETLTFEDVSHEAIDKLGLSIDKTNWFSTYRVHHRVSDRFRKGRVFLLGDAAHVHSPAGGQGMNTGIADAINLAWKLAAVIKQQAPDRLLDSYHVERHAFALKLVDTTDRLFTFVSADGNFAQFVRTRIAPLAASVIWKIDAVREFLFRTASQTALEYQDSPLSGGKAGRVRGGDRLPWVSLPGADNYEHLRDIDWQMHVYGTATAELAAWCQQRGVVLHVFDWAQEHKDAGLARDAVYLLRPDTYVAFADPEPSITALNRYAEARGFLFNA